MSAIATAIVVTAGYSYDQNRKAMKKSEEAARRAEDAARAEAERQRQEELARQGRIKEGRTKIDEAFNQFNDDFYNERAKAYENYATPTLDRQYEDSMRELVTALARSGNLQSSTRAEKMAGLNEEYKQRKLDILNTGLDYKNQARSAVDQARAELQVQNASLADPNLISGNATARAASLTQMPSFSPIGDLLSDFASGLATQADLERRQIAKYNTGLFNSDLNRSGGRIIR